MISKCANPECAKTLMRLDGGRFFGFYTDRNSNHKTIENFWLCSTCAKSYTLQQIEGNVELRLRERKTA